MRISDWSSDVCSSDLSPPMEIFAPVAAMKASAAWDGWIRSTDVSASGETYPSNCETLNTRDARATKQRSGSSSDAVRSDEHTSELQSLMRISYAVFCLKKNSLYAR